MIAIWLGLAALAVSVGALCWWALHFANGLPFDDPAGLSDGAQAELHTIRWEAE